MENQEATDIKLNVAEPSQTKRILTIEVSTEKIEPEFKKTYKAIQKKAKWPGFRPGKVPIQMIRTRMSQEAEQDILQRIIPAFYSRALKEAALDPVDMPIIRNVHLKEGEPFRFDATVYIKPQFEVKEYKGLPSPIKEIQVADEMVDNVLRDMQDQAAELISFEDEAQAVEKGDVAEADFEGFLGDKPIEGAKSENHLVEVGAGKMLPDLENAFMGMKKGEEKEVTVTFPETYHASHLAGQTTVFKVRLNDIKEKKLPDLDDEFAKDIGEKFETLEELKSEIREKIRGREESKGREEARIAMMDEVLRRNPIEELPEVMVERHKRSLKQSMESHLQNSGVAKEEIEKIIAEEKLDVEAERHVAWSLILEQIASKEGIAVGAEELDKELERKAMESSVSKDVFRDLYTQEMGSMEPFRLTLLNEKILDFLLENAKVTDRGGAKKEGVTED